MPWTEEEIAKLKKLFSEGRSDEEITKELKRVSVNGIKCFRLKHQLYRNRKTIWTEKNLKALYDNQELTNFALGALLQIDESEVFRKRKELGLPTCVYKRWTEDELKFLKKHYSTKTNTWLSKKLNWDAKAIRAKAYSLALVKEGKYEY